MVSLLELLTLPRNLLRLLFRVVVLSTTRSNYPATISYSYDELLALPPAASSNVFLIDAPAAPVPKYAFDFCTAHEVYTKTYGNTTCPFTPFDYVYTDPTSTETTANVTWLLVAMSLPILTFLLIVLIATFRGRAAEQPSSNEDIVAPFGDEKLSGMLLTGASLYYSTDTKVVGGPYEDAPELNLEVAIDSFYESLPRSGLQDMDTLIDDLDVAAVDVVEAETSRESTIHPSNALANRRTFKEVNKSLLYLEHSFVEVPADAANSAIESPSHTPMHTALEVMQVAVETIEVAAIHEDRISTAREPAPLFAIIKQTNLSDEHVDCAAPLTPCATTPLETTILEAITVCGFEPPAEHGETESSGGSDHGSDATEEDRASDVGEHDVLGSIVIVDYPATPIEPVHPDSAETEGFQVELSTAELTAVAAEFDNTDDFTPTVSSQTVEPVLEQPTEQGLAMVEQKMPDASIDEVLNLLDQAVDPASGGSESLAESAPLDTPSSPTALTVPAPISEAGLEEQVADSEASGDAGVDLVDTSVKPAEPVLAVLETMPLDKLAIEDHSSTQDTQENTTPAPDANLVDDAVHPTEPSASETKPEFTAEELGDVEQEPGFACELSIVEPTPDPIQRLAIEAEAEPVELPMAEAEAKPVKMQYHTTNDSTESAQESTTVETIDVKVEQAETGTEPILETEYHIHDNVTAPLDETSPSSDVEAESHPDSAAEEVEEPSAIVNAGLPGASTDIRAEAPPSPENVDASDTVIENDGVSASASGTTAVEEATADFESSMVTETVTTVAEDVEAPALVVAQSVVTPEEPFAESPTVSSSLHPDDDMVLLHEDTDSDETPSDSISEPAVPSTPPTPAEDMPSDMTLAKVLPIEAFEMPEIMEVAPKDVPEETPSVDSQTVADFAVTAASDFATENLASHSPVVEPVAHLDEPQSVDSLASAADSSADVDLATSVLEITVGLEHESSVRLETIGCSDASTLSEDDQPFATAEMSTSSRDEPILEASDLMEDASNATDESAPAVTLHDELAEASAASPSKQVCEDREPSYTKLPKRVARKMSLSAQECFDKELLDEESFVADANHQRKVQTRGGKVDVEEILELLDECFKAGMEPEEVDGMLDILNRPVYADFQGIASNAKDSDDGDRNSSTPAEDTKYHITVEGDALEVEDWDAVTMTESCRLATTESD